MDNKSLDDTDDERSMMLYMASLGHNELILKKADEIWD